MTYGTCLGCDVLKGSLHNW